MGIVIHIATTRDVSPAVMFDNDKFEFLSFVYMSGREKNVFFLIYSPTFPFANAIFTLQINLGNVHYQFKSRGKQYK